MGTQLRLIKHLLTKSPTIDGRGIVINSLRLAALALLAGCAAPPPLPAGSSSFAVPRQVHVVQTKAGEPDLDTVLVVQREGRALRWSLFDPLGVPQTRQLLESGQWRNDGFVRPNATARELFAALMFAWTAPADLDAAYGKDDWRSTSTPPAADRSLFEHGVLRWNIHWPQAEQTDTFTVTVTGAGANVWLVEPLKEQP